MNNNSCFKPKVFHYFSNGTGRDSYVIERNAGFTKQPFTPGYDFKTDKYEQMTTKIGEKTKIKQFEPKTNHYFSDGSGRDHYITSTEGGQCEGYVQNMDQKNKAFALRSYNKGGKVAQDDFYQRSQRQYKTNSIAQQILKSRQSEVGMSLSQPKGQYHYGDSTKLLSLREDPLKKYQNK